ncbi:O-antigen ligase family protein [Roseateles sp. P5_E7]
MSFASAPHRAAAAWHKVLAVVGGSVGGGTLLTLGSGAVSSPWVVLAMPVALTVLVVLMLSPTLSFLLTALIVPVERLGRLTDDSAMYTISLMRIVGTITLGSLLLTALLRRQRLYFGSAFWVYSLYFGIAITGVFHTTHTLGTVRHCGAILGNLLFLFLAVNLGRSHKLARNAVAVWLFSTAAAGIYTILTWHFGPGVTEAGLGDTDSRFSTVLKDTSEWEALDTVARATGPTSHSAVYGMNLITSLPLYLYFLKHMASRAWKWLILVAIAVTLYNVLLTNTRAVMLVAALTLGVCGLRGLYRVSAGGVAVAVFAVLAMLPLVPSAIWSRVLDTSQYSESKSATLRARFEYWEAGLSIINDHWLTGIGVGNQLEVPKRINFISAEETTVHNEFLYTAMEVGVFGWLVFFGFVALMYAAARRAQRMAPHRLPPRELHADFFVAIQVSMLATLVFGLQVDVFHFPLKGWWLLAGLAFAQYRAMADAAPLPHPPEATAHVHTHALVR